MQSIIKSITCLKEDKLIKTLKTSTSIIVLLLLAIGALVNGFAISTLWLWFISTPFNITAISIPHAIGIDLLLTYIVSMKYSDKEYDDSWYIKAATYAIFCPLWVLVLGYLVQLFM